MTTSRINRLALTHFRNCRSATVEAAAELGALPLPAGAGAASERRRFLERLVLAIDSGHPTRVNALERSLRSRNRLLETPSPDPHWLDAVEHETAQLAVAVAAMRGQTVTRLQASLAARGL